MAHYLDPADKVIRSFGGAGTLGKLLGLHRTQIHRWRTPKERGGCDGIIPRSHHVKLLELASVRDDIDIKDADLVPWLPSRSDAA